MHLPECTQFLCPSNNCPVRRCVGVIFECPEMADAIKKVRDGGELTYARLSQYYWTGEVCQDFGRYAGKDLTVVAEEVKRKST